MSHDSGAQAVPDSAPQTDLANAARIAARHVVPIVRTCPEHGPWKASYIDASGVERTSFACPQCVRDYPIKQFVMGLHGRYRSATLGNFEAFDPEMEDALALASAYVDQAASSGRNAILFGPPGTGKTHLGIAIARAVIALGQSAVYARCDQMVEAMIQRSRKAEGWRDADALPSAVSADACLSARLLVLDEVGRFSLTAPQASALFRVIDQRNGDDLPTVLITNAGKAEDLSAVLSPAGYDRISGGAIKIEFNWPSFRSR